MKKKIFKDYQKYSILQSFTGEQMPYSTGSNESLEGMTSVKRIEQSLYGEPFYLGNNRTLVIENPFKDINGDIIPLNIIKKKI